MQKEFRLRKNEHFQRVFHKGRSVANRQFVLYYSHSETAHFRLGVSISKKVGHAVIRNRVKRLVKEAVRGMVDGIPKGVDLVVIVRKPAVELSYEEVVSSLKHVLKRAKLYGKARV